MADDDHCEGAESEVIGGGVSAGYGDQASELQDIKVSKDIRNPREDKNQTCLRRASLRKG